MKVTDYELAYSAIINAKHRILKNFEEEQKNLVKLNPDEILMYTHYFNEVIWGLDENLRKLARMFEIEHPESKAGFAKEIRTYLEPKGETIE